MKLYTNIKYIQGNIVHDTTILFNAYNIIAGFSSFISEIIYFSKKLQKLWTYSGIFYFSILFLKEKNITHYIMDVSKEYLKKMKAWKNKSIQYNLMINEKCNDSKFIIVK